jgi:hypothetical protein
MLNSEDALLRDLLRDLAKLKVDSEAEGLELALDVVQTLSKEGAVAQIKRLIAERSARAKELSRRMTAEE